MSTRKNYVIFMLLTSGMAIRYDYEAHTKTKAIEVCQQAWCERDKKTKAIYAVNINTGNIEKMFA